MIETQGATPRLQGVHHTARPTWKLKETVEFYRDVLGLRLVHAISARGWGPADHPDFLHFFFDSGNGSTIAFFYYLGHAQPEHLVHRPRFDSDATHTAWQVHSRDQLAAWRQRLEGRGIEVLFQIEHEVIESLYFRDPNGYFVEISVPLRDLQPLDASDAELTVRAAIEEEDRRITAGLGKLQEIETVWRAKGELLARQQDTANTADFR
jgi:catechol 2,3-dioxygenase-like lactoylglutathione lyase family enzyme